LGAKFEYDLKIIALSDFRQLGLTTLTISIGLSSLAFFFYLLTHALLKALVPFVPEVNHKIFVFFVV